MSPPPLIPWRHWLPKPARFEQVLVRNADTKLFADSRSGQRVWAPTMEETRWAVFRITKDA